MYDKKIWTKKIYILKGNRPFPSCLLPLFQGEVRQKNNVCLQVNENSFSYERFCTYPRFETEAKGNSKMAHSTSGSIHLFLYN